VRILLFVQCEDKTNSGINQGGDYTLTAEGRPFSFLAAYNKIFLRGNDQLIPESARILVRVPRLNPIQEGSPRREPCLESAFRQLGRL
jgi:hypothetical protein